MTPFAPELVHCPIVGRRHEGGSAMSAVFSAFCYVIGTLLASGLATSAVAADCGPLFSASEKQARTPYRATVSSHAVLPRGMPAALAPAQATQLIYTGSTLYLLIEGHWMKRPMTAEIQLKQI